MRSGRCKTEGISDERKDGEDPWGESVSEGVIGRLDEPRRVGRVIGSGLVRGNGRGDVTC